MSKKLTMKSLLEMVEELSSRIVILETKVSGIRDRGPSSTRQMTDEDARRVICGDLKDVPHKVVAEKLGLSYGQIYSARSEYTFKHIWEGIWKDKIKEKS